MAGNHIPLAVTAATFGGLVANDYPDGQRVTITDDGEKEYEARGADGARTWVLLHTGHVTDHEAASTPHDHGDLAGLADFTTDHGTEHDAHDHSTAMGTVVLDDISDVTETTITSGDLLRWNGTAWVNYPDSNFAGAGTGVTGGDAHDHVGGDGAQIDHGGLAGLADFGADHGTEHDAHDHSTALGTAAISDLADVTAPTPTVGDLLRWNGTAWVPVPDTNYATSGHGHAAADVTTGTFANARISQGSVTQHQAALSITESQISNLHAPPAFAGHRNTTVTTHATATRTVSSTITIPTGWTTYMVKLDWCFRARSNSGTRRLFTITPRFKSVSVAGQAFDHTMENTPQKDDVVAGTAWFTGQTGTGSRSFDIVISLNASDSNVSSDDVTLFCTAYKQS